MIIRSIEFVKSAVKPSDYPPAVLPEIVFSGRSNVGKSSLINVLVNRKRLARTSSTPGRTQLINFFEINGALAFVDIPGYGYAKVPAKVKVRWASMIETYLSTRETLKGLVLIMDIRRNPGPVDASFVEWLTRRQLPTVLVLTKADKLSRAKQLDRQRLAARALPDSSAEIILFSAKTRLGRDRVWKAIEVLINAGNSGEGRPCR
jgi:GTP-binding protein